MEREGRGGGGAAPPLNKLAPAAAPVLLLEARVWWRGLSFPLSYIEQWSSPPEVGVADMVPVYMDFDWAYRADGPPLKVMEVDAESFAAVSSENYSIFLCFCCVLVFTCTSPFVRSFPSLSCSLSMTSSAAAYHPAHAHAATATTDTDHEPGKETRAKMIDEGVAAPGSSCPNDRARVQP